MDCPNFFKGTKRLLDPDGGSCFTNLKLLPLDAFAEHLLWHVLGICGLARCPEAFCWYSVVFKASAS